MTNKLFRSFLHFVGTGLLTLLTSGCGSRTADLTRFISDDTSVFIQIDISKVSLDDIKAKLRNKAEAVVKEASAKGEIPKENIQQAQKQIETGLNEAEQKIRPIFETITKKIGVKQFAVIVDNKLQQDYGIEAVAVVPIKKGAKDDVDMLLAFVSGLERERIHFVGNYLVIAEHPPTVAKSNTQQVVTDWIEKAQKSSPSKNNPVYQALQACRKNDVVKIAAAPSKITVPSPNGMNSRLDFKELLMLADAGLATLPELASFLPFEMQRAIPQGAQNGIGFLVQKLREMIESASKVDWVSASFSPDDLLAVSETKAVLGIIKTKGADDAKKLGENLEKIIDWATIAAKMLPSPDSEPASVAMLDWVKRGKLKSLVPEVKGDKLTFHYPSGLGGLDKIFLNNIFEALPDGRKECGNHAHQIALAFHNYASASVYGYLPPLYTVDKNGKPLHSWRVHILPYIEQVVLYNKIRLDEPWDSEHNKQFHHADIPYFRCPYCPGGKPGDCNYSAIVGGVLAPAKDEEQIGRIRIDALRKGTANTLAIVETKKPFCWMDPTADVTMDELLKGINAKEGRVGSHHPDGGIHAAMFDGSVQHFSDNTPKETLRALADPNGGQVVPMPRPAVSPPSRPADKK